MAPSNNLETTRLHQLLPELLSSLCEKFDNVECEVENSPDFSQLPYKLPITKIGSQICMVPTSADLQAAIKEHLNGGASLGVLNDFHVLCSSGQSPSLGLRIALKNSIPSTSAENRKNWRSTVLETVRRFYSSLNLSVNSWEFLCVEWLEGEKNGELVLLSKSIPVFSNNNSSANSSTLTVWLFPFTKIVSGNQNGTVTNGTTTTTNIETPKAKKKVIRRVVKGTNPDGTPKKTLVSTKTEKLSNGTKVVKKTIVDKSTPKENSPGVVQEIVEDQSSVSYLVRLGQSPVNDPSLLAAQLPQKLNQELTNGNMIHVNGDVVNGSVVNGDTKLENGGTKIENGVMKENNDSITNGVMKENNDSITNIKKLENGHDSITNGLHGKSVESDKLASISEQNKLSTLSALSTIKAPDLLIVDQTKPSPPSQSSNTASNTTTTHSITPIIPLPPIHRTPSLPAESIPIEPCGPWIIQQSDKLGDGESSDSNTLTENQVIEDKSNTVNILDTVNSSNNTVNSSITSNTVQNLIPEPRLNQPPSIIPMNRRTASPLTLNDSTIAHSSFNSNLSGRRLSAGNPVSPTESDVSFIDDISFSSTLTAPTTSSRLPLIKREISPIDEYPPEVKMRGMADVPVVALQLVFALFSYKELSELRRVHPHWDELCGQLLNSGYYELINRADILTNECQRRVIAEKHLQRPLQILTNIQLHVLNPVDILRAAMDEGVLCFPYGEILDRAFDLLDKIEQVMGMSEEDGDGVVLNWERLGKLSRMAQIHYRQYVEPEVEKRMTEVYKLSAQQRLQRLDSFLVETTVSKLEKTNEKTREDLKWEVEQLKTQNTQLKRDNRDLKQTCAKLDSRIDTIERKLKTLGRLLQ